MNRAERRKAKKQGIAVPKDPVYNIKNSDIKRMKEKAVDEAAGAAMVLLFAIPVKVMRDKYGFGSKRLTALADALTEEYQNFSDGDTSLEEYADLVYQYTGIKFERSK